jgi:hypothetical protein
MVSLLSEKRNYQPHAITKIGERFIQIAIEEALSKDGILTFTI